MALTPLSELRPEGDEELRENVRSLRPAAEDGGGCGRTLAVTRCERRAREEGPARGAGREACVRGAEEDRTDRTRGKRTRERDRVSGGFARFSRNGSDPARNPAPFPLEPEPFRFKQYAVERLSGTLSGGSTVVEETSRRARRLSPQAASTRRSPPPSMAGVPRFRHSMDSEVDFSWGDGKKLCSVLWHDEVLLNKKRRWLMRSDMIFPSDGTRKKKRPKFLSSKFLPESYLRTDDVFSEMMIRNIDKSFGFLGDSEVSHHVVQDYLQVLDLHKFDSCSVTPSDFLRDLSSIIHDLNNNALCRVANSITLEKAIFEKRRSRMKKIIIKYLHMAVAESSGNDRLILLKQLAEIFRNPSSFRKKQLTLFTPLSPSLLSSIHKILEGLNEVPIQTLAAINRKLRGVTVAPQFPPVKSTSSRALLIQRVRKKFQKFLLTLQEGTDLPKPLARALSVMRLSVKQETKRVDILTSEFFPFPSEIADLQNEILKALWSFHKLRYEEIKALRLILDPKARVSKKTFRLHLRMYLLEYLFECNDVDIPDELLRTLALINSKSTRWPFMCLKKRREEEAEAVLNMNSHLTQLILNTLKNRRIDEDSASEFSEILGSDDDGDTNDFKLQANEYCSNLDKPRLPQLQERLLVDEETTGDSRPHASSIPADSRGQGYLPTVATSGNIFSDSAFKEPKLELGAGGNDVALRSSQELMKIHSSNYLPLIQDVCDETSLFAYNLIGHVLEKFMLMKGIELDALMRSYLRGGSLPPDDLQGGLETIINSPKEDIGCSILFRVLEELLPSFPRSSIEKLKQSMGLPLCFGQRGFN